MNRMPLRTALALCLACATAPLARAADSTATASPVTVTGAVTGIFSPMSDLGDGQAEWSAVTLSGNVKRQFVPAFSAGLALAYHEEYWAFRSPSGASSYWGEFVRPSVALNFTLALSRTVVLGLSPGAEWPSAPQATAADAFTYGAVFSALKVFSPKFVFGGGVSAYRQFYNVKTSPFVIINWRLTDRLRIANALPAGPEGGAGVELRYAPDARWEFAAGGVSRGARFRLAPTVYGAAAGQTAREIGETQTIPLFARVSRSIGERTKADLYAGGLFRGSLRVKDSGGHDIESAEWGPAPAFALTLSGKF